METWKIVRAILEEANFHSCFCRKLTIGSDCVTIVWYEKLLNSIDSKGNIMPSKKMKIEITTKIAGYIVIKVCDSADITFKFGTKEFRIISPLVSSLERKALELYS